MRAFLQVNAASLCVCTGSGVGRIRVCLKFPGIYKNAFHIPGVATGGNAQARQYVTCKYQGAAIKITFRPGHFPAIVHNRIKSLPSVRLRISKIIIFAYLLHNCGGPVCQAIIQAFQVYIPWLAVPFPDADLFCGLISRCPSLNSSVFVNTCMANQYSHLITPFLIALYCCIYRIPPGHVLTEYSVIFR